MSAPPVDAPAEGAGLPEAGTGLRGPSERVLAVVVLVLLFATVVLGASVALRMHALQAHARSAADALHLVDAAAG